MQARLNPNLRATMAPPVMEARRWLLETPLPGGKTLLNLSQAAPVDPPPEPLRKAIAEFALTDAGAHLYGPVLGLPELRTEIAERWCVDYGGAVSPENVAITSGCNQAFCAAIASVAGAGEEVILPYPWYFNHAMWLQQTGIRIRPLPCTGDMVPDPAQVEPLVTPRTRAIVLVTPNNPTGAEYPAETLSAFADIARRHGLALIVDETYRDFDSRTGAPHALFEAADWGDWLIQLYSFSKAFRLTGHRVGALVTGRGRMKEVEKFLDTVTICPNQLGQRAALWGMRNLRDWLAGERQEILRRRAAMAAGFAALSGWQILGLGAYFAYLRHPSPLPSPELARRLLADQAVLVLPGTMFAPAECETARSELRVAFANADAAGIATLFDRLAAFDG